MAEKLNRVLVFTLLMLSVNVAFAESDPFADLEKGIGTINRVKQFWVTLDEMVQYSPTGNEEELSVVSPTSPAQKIQFAKVKAEFASEEQQKVWAAWLSERAAPFRNLSRHENFNVKAVHTMMLVNKANRLLPEDLRIPFVSGNVEKEYLSDSYREKIEGSPAWAWITDPPLKGLPEYARILKELH